MTLLDEDRLRQLRQVPVAPPRSLDEVVARAAALRRARRARRAGAGVILGTAALAVLSVLVTPAQVRSPVRFDVFAPPSAVAQQDCLVSAVDPAQVPGTARYVVGDDLAVPPLTGWSATRSPCTAPQPGASAAASAVQRTRDDRVLAAITVWGPGAGPFVEGDGDEAGTLSPVQVRGGTGQLLRRVDGGLGIAWQEAGAGWVAQSLGLTADQLVAALDGLAVQEGVVTRWSAGGAFDVTLDDRERVLGPTWSTSARYGHPDGREEGFWVTVDSHVDPALDGSLAGGWEPVDVVGADPTVTGAGAHLSTPGTGTLMLTWQTPDGRRFSVDGTLTLPEALEVARSLRRVGPDDPRIAPPAAAARASAEAERARQQRGG